MKRNRFKPTPDDQTSENERYDHALGKASADDYERRAKNRKKVHELDIWIAVGLYLILSSVAFVILY